jgi:hypothetical protein
MNANAFERVIALLDRFDNLCGATVCAEQNVSERFFLKLLLRVRGARMKRATVFTNNN